MTPRETAIRTLAEALETVAPGLFSTPMGDAAAILAASPTLARWLEFGAAWDAAEAAALLVGWTFYGVRQFRVTVDAERYRATAYNDRPPDPGPWVLSYGHQTRCDGYGPTPTAALVALAEELREVPR